jgi:hypothetical protein
VVLYFYSRDMTSGCTKQACAFSELYPQFREAGAEIVGVSKDTVASHKRFEEKYGLPFTLLSDTEKEVLAAYDVLKEKKSAGKISIGVVRTTYLIDEEGWYYSAEDVALYLATYDGELPDNFITKNEARDLGWEGGSVEKYAPGCAIGGDRFQNREEVLPVIEGVIYYECDIDTNGTSSRGAERIVFSNDGWIYYTPDHYETFELLYEDAW